MKLVVQIALGVILGVVLLIAGCAALLRAGSSEARSRSDKTDGPLPPGRSVTRDRVAAFALALSKLY